MKKRLLLVASLPVTIAVILGVLAMLPPDDRPGVTKANFDRIEEGMTRAEVEEIFGRPSDKIEGLTRAEIELTRAEIEQMAGGGKAEEFLIRIGPNNSRSWTANDGAEAEIYFKNDCVTGKLWLDSHGTFLDKIRRWLHLR
jgi:hypothetical protein